MLPAGPLMVEHRLIEKMIAIIKKALVKIKETSSVNPAFVDTVVDFFRTYADRTHHGKEEDILFRGLAQKKLSAPHQKMMNDLIQEHVCARGKVRDLVAAKERYVQKDESALKDIAARLQDLTLLYPAHIEKEDKNFFLPIMDYFSLEEQETMLQEFQEFDKKMIHEKYKKIVEQHSS